MHSAGLSLCASPPPLLRANAGIQAMDMRAEDLAEQTRIMALAETLGQSVLRSNAALLDSARQVPSENFAALASAGLLGLTVPANYGGLGVSRVTLLKVLETLSRYCAVTAF